MAAEGALPSLAPAKRGIVFVMAVWGGAFVHRFLRIALPTLLSPGNLPASAQMRSCRFLFVTAPTDIETIRSDKLFRRLQDLVDISFSSFEPSKDQYAALSIAHAMAAKSAAERHEAAVFLAPDAIIADGALSSIIEMANAGARAIMATGLRLTEETVYPALAELPRDEVGALNLAPRAMVKIALSHLHPETLRYIWGGDNFTAHPQLCMWSSPNDDGFLIRAFHLHPILVDFDGVRDLSMLGASTIDGNFLGMIIGRWAEIRIIDDSDKFIMFSLTPFAQRDHYLSSGLASTESLRAMAYSAQVNPLHRYFFSQATRLHTKDLDVQWIELEERTGQLAYQALDLNADESLTVLVERMSGRELLRLLAQKISNRLSSWRQ